jgi:hypothetical protein
MPLLSTLVGATVEEIKKRCQSEYVGLTSGNEEIDAMLGGGFRRGELTYLVADNGIGKSRLVENWVINAARFLLAYPDFRPAPAFGVTGAVEEQEKKPPLIVIWNLEMGPFVSVVRMLTNVMYDVYKVKLDSSRVLEGRIKTGEQISKLRDAASTLEELSQFIYLESDIFTVSAMERRIVELKERYDVVMLVVDYFRLIRDGSTEGAAKQEKVSAELNGLKRYDCHILAIFDVNAGGQQVRIPDKTHMKWGTAASFDGDTILGLGWLEPEPDKEGRILVRLKTTKSRHGQLGQVDLLMDLSTGHVETYDPARTVEEFTMPLDIPPLNIEMPLAG